MFKVEIASMTKKNTSRVAGGIARAQKLTPGQRSDIAKAAASARWGIPVAEHTGSLRIGDWEIPCAVLPDGRRVLSQRGVMAALGRKHGGSDFRASKTADDNGGKMPIYLAANSLKPFISNSLAEVVSNPVKYASKHGGGPAFGVEASMLPQICDVWLKAREASALTKSQLAIAYRAEILMRGLAHVGIVALVDEATGYQEVRDKLALQAILDKFLKKEFAAWAKRFPDEFYQQMFRLKGWGFNPVSVARPGVVGRYTTDIVYERLAPGIVEELEKNNPKNERGNRRARHHQWLSDDVGHPALAQHLHAVVGLMRACSDWEQFKDLLDRAFPRKGHTIPMLLE